ncbi:hypothetical protein LDENG_00217210 [Lucifuga dentata]|nr:hypothetical protein LDENG_00217210 [Lucifuga dentata]
MASTSITTVGGVTIVTHVFPQDENAKNSIPLQTAISPPAPPTIPEQPVTPPPLCPASPAKMSDMMSTFLRGQPQGLGPAQVFVGLLCFLFGLTFVYSPMMNQHAPLCAGILFVLSGSLVVMVMRRSSVCLMGVTLASNLLSALLALMGVAYVCWLLSDRSIMYRRLCDVTAPRVHYDYGYGHTSNTECTRMVSFLYTILDGLRGVLAVLLLLQFCFAVTLSVFSAKAISRRERYGSCKVLVDDDSSGVTAMCVPPSRQGSDELPLDGKEETPLSPP